MGSFYKPTPNCVEPNLVGTTERESWVRMALQYLRVRRARDTCGFQQLFTAEDLAIEMKVYRYPAPPDERMWGTIMQRAKRDGLIRDTGDKRLTRAGHRTPVWTWA